MLTILEGSTFCISDDRGDIAAETSGFFAHDTRFLSRLVLSVGGAQPLLLSSGRVQHFQAAFYLRNRTVDGIPKDSLSIARERFVGTGMQERISIRNESASPISLDVALEAEADFADIISVKHHDFSLGDPELAQELPPPAPAVLDARRNQLSIVDPRGDLGTQLLFSQPGALDDNAMTFALALGPH
jgi:glycogen debranching enzyme